MHRGYIKLHRKALENGLIKNPSAWQLMCYCLLKATHKPRQEIVGNMVVDLLPGQFVFGRKKTSSDLKMKESQVRRSIELLKTCGFLSRKSNNKFSVVSILKWGIYQSEEPTNDQQTTNKRPTNDQQTTTNKNIKNTKNIKNEKKKKSKPEISLIEKVRLVFSKYSDNPEITEALNDYAKMRLSIKSPLTERAAKGILKKVTKFSTDDDSKIDLLERAIIGNWKSIYAPDENFGTRKGKTSGNGFLDDLKGGGF